MFESKTAYGTTRKYTVHFITIVPSRNDSLGQVTAECRNPEPKSLCRWRKQVDKQSQKQK